jgi:hypothetical protein
MLQRPSSLALDSCLGYLVGIREIDWGPSEIGESMWDMRPLILPPYRIIRQMYILRQILTINFSQKNMKYLT